MQQLTTAPIHLASCASCGAYGEGKGSITTYATEVPHPGPFHCPRCRPGMLSAAEQLAADKYPLVSFVDESPYAQWCVLEILPDDLIRVRVLGRPDSAIHVRHVNEIRPKFSYAKLEAERRAGRAKR